MVSITHLTFDRRVPLSREIETSLLHPIKEIETADGSLLLTLLREAMQNIAGPDWVTPLVSLA